MKRSSCIWIINLQQQEFRVQPKHISLQHPSMRSNNGLVPMTWHSRVKSRVNLVSEWVSNLFPYSLTGLTHSIGPTNQGAFVDILFFCNFVLFVRKHLYKWTIPSLRSSHAPSQWSLPPHFFTTWTKPTIYLRTKRNIWQLVVLA